MSSYLAMIEAKFSEHMKRKDDKDWREKTLLQAEKLSGLTRERLLSITIVMSAVYLLLGNFLPLFSHIICMFWPLKESFKILRAQQKPTDNVLLYWILYALVSFFDYSSLPGVPFYYFAKIALFLSITTNGVEKLKEWAEPALKFTESWVLVPAVIEETDD